MKTIYGLLIFLFFVVIVYCEAEIKKLEEQDVLEVADARQKARHLPLDEDYLDHDDGLEGSVEVSSGAYVGDKHLKGNQNLGNVVEDHSTDLHHDRGSHQDFSQGGANFNKHHTENIADNKELENVKQHDAGEKFGAEALKEHKLGKHKEKSKGHKLHGFKNTYHKEEYGDHKTFHDEFLDTDHHHNYDDHHEHRQLQGGKFSKGFKHEGKNNNFDKGDEAHEWGKAGHDGYDDGKYESGGHGSKHHHGHKKHEGHQEATAHEGKNSYKKQKKGEVPQYYSQGVHHGSHEKKGDVPQYYSEGIHHGPQDTQYDGHYSDNHHSTPHTYHGHHTYPSLDEGHYGNDHGSYVDHEERSPSAKRIPNAEHRNAYSKPVSVEKLKSPLYKDLLSEVPLPNRLSEPLKRAPIYKDIASEISVPYNHNEPIKRRPLYKDNIPEMAAPHRHSERPKMENFPQFKPTVSEMNVPRHLNERTYSQPIQATHEQFYHRFPKHEKHRFHSHPKQYENNFSLQSASPQLRQPTGHQPPSLGHSHLTNHPHSKPYNWHDRESGQHKYQVTDPRVPEPSRFDAVQPKVADHLQRTQYVPKPSQHHYSYY